MMMYKALSIVIQLMLGTAALTAPSPKPNLLLLTPEEVSSRLLSLTTLSETKWSYSK